MDADRIDYVEELLGLDLKLPMEVEYDKLVLDSEAGNPALAGGESFHQHWNAAKQTSVGKAEHRKVGRSRDADKRVLEAD